MIKAVRVIFIDPLKRQEITGNRIEVKSQGRHYSIFAGHEPQIIFLEKAEAVVYSENEEPLVSLINTDGICFVERSSVTCILENPR